MTEASVAEFGAAQAGEAPLRELMDPVTRFLAQASGEHFTGSVGDHLPDADVDALGRGDEANVLAAGLRDALSAGNDGFIDDELALMTNWGFDLQNVHVPVTIWHGEQTATCASDTDGSSPNSSTAPRSTSCPATATSRSPSTTPTASRTTSCVEHGVQGTNPERDQDRTPPRSQPPDPIRSGVRDGGEARVSRRAVYRLGRGRRRRRRSTRARRSAGRTSSRTLDLRSHVRVAISMGLIRTLMAERAKVLSWTMDW